MAEPTRTQSERFPYDSATKPPRIACRASDGFRRGGTCGAAQEHQPKPSAGWLHAGLIVILSIWILHSFLEALLAACVTAIASWPLYARFSAELPWRLDNGAGALIFTLGDPARIVPMMFAVGARSMKRTH